MGIRCPTRPLASAPATSPTSMIRLDAIASSATTKGLERGKGVCGSCNMLHSLIDPSDKLCGRVKAVTEHDDEGKTC